MKFPTGLSQLTYRWIKWMERQVEGVPVCDERRQGARDHLGQLVCQQVHIEPDLREVETEG